MKHLGEWVIGYHRQINGQTNGQLLTLAQGGVIYDLDFKCIALIVKPDLC